MNPTLRRYLRIRLPAICLTLAATAGLAVSQQVVTYPVGESATATGYMQAVAGSLDLDYFSAPAPILGAQSYSFTTASSVNAFGSLSVFSIPGEPSCDTSVTLAATGIPGMPFQPGASTEVAMNANGSVLQMALYNDAYNEIDIQRSGHVSPQPLRLSCFSENADNDQDPLERGNRFTVPFEAANLTSLTIQTTLTRTDNVQNGTLQGVTDLRVIVLSYVPALETIVPVFTSQNLQLSAMQQPSSLMSVPETILLNPGKYYVQVFFRAGSKLVAGSNTCIDKLAQSTTRHTAFVDVRFQ